MKTLSFQGNFYSLKTIALSLLFLIPLALYASGLGINVFFPSYIDRDFDSSFSKASVVAIVAPHPEIAFSERQICDLWRFTQNKAARHSAIAAIYSPFEVRKTKIENRTLSYPRLIAENCYRANDSEDKIADLSQLNNTPWQGILTNENHSDLLFEFIVSEKSDDRQLSAFLNLLKSETDNMGLSLHLTGDRYLEFSLKNGLLADQALNFYLAIALLLMFRMLFKSWSAGIALLICLSTSALVLAACIRFLGIELNLLTNGIFLICAIASIQDFIFLYQKREPGQSVLELINAVKIPCLATTATTVIGFGSLYFTDIAIIKEFGLLAALGAIIEYIVLFLLAPPLISSLAKPTSLVDRLGFSIGHFKLKNRWLTASIVIGILAPIGFLNTFPDENPLSSFDTEHPLRTGTEYLRTHRSWTHKVDVAVSKDSKRLEEIETRLEQLPGVAIVNSAREYVDYFTAGYETSMSRLIGDEVKNSFYYDRYDGQKWILSTYINQLQARQLLNTHNAINKICQSDCKVGGMAFSYASFSKKIVPALVKSFIGSLTLIVCFLVVFSYFYSGKVQIAAIFFSLWGAVVTCGLFSMLAMTPINYLTCIVAAVLLGTTGDNAIHYIYAGREQLQSGIREKASGSFGIAVMSALGSLVLLFSEFTYPRILGVVLFFGFILSLVGDIILLNSWLWLKVKFSEAKQTTLATKNSAKISLSRHQ